MSQGEEDNYENESEEQFKIEDIEEIHQSINSLEKKNNSNNSQSYPVEYNNQNYNLNNIEISNKENINSNNNLSDRNYLVESDNIISNREHYNNTEEDYNNINDNNNINNINFIINDNNNINEINNDNNYNIINEKKNDINYNNINDIINYNDTNDDNKDNYISENNYDEIYDNNYNNANDNITDDNNINNNFDNNVNDNNSNNKNINVNKISINSINDNIDIYKNISEGCDDFNENINSNIEGPINLIEFHRNNFVLNEKALNILKSIKDNLIIVSIVGKARTGKSYLMNLLLNNNKSKYPGNGFEISSRLDSCTRGIWLWNTPRQKPNSSSKIIFIDSEGTNSVDLSTKTYDSKIFALIVLISSLFIYNTNGNIDEKSISDLALAAHLSNTVATNAIEDKDLLINELAPKFIWVLRDFVLEKIDPDTGDEISSNEYLELCLRNKSNNNKNSMENNLIRENIIKYFKDRECITLPRPVDKEEDLHRLNEIPFSGLKPNFREEFLNLKKKIYEDSKIKKIGKKKINGPILVELLISFINSLNSKIIPNIDTAIDNIVINDIEKSYDECLKLWKENYTKIKDKNCNLKDLYEIKYNIINEYNTVINENKDIKNNNQFFDIYINNKNKLENEIQNDINKINILNNNKKNILLNDILNKHKNINYNLNINYNSETEQKDLIFNSINENYSNFIKDIKTNLNNFDEEKALDIIINKDIEHNNNSIKEIVNVINRDYDNKISEIESQIKEEELNIKTYDISKFNNIIETLNQRYEILNKELDLNHKELFGLIGKYTKLVEQRDKMVLNKKNNEIKKVEPDLTLMRSQKFQKGFCGITVESGEKGCGCEIGDFCYIF